MTVRLCPAIVIFRPGDVILAEIVPGLHFDENQWSISRVLDTMPGALGDVHGLASRETDLFVIKDQNSLAFEYEPVLLPAPVFLKREPLPRVDNDPLYLVSRRIFEHTKMAPRPVILLVHRLYSRGHDAALSTKEASMSQIEA